MKRTSATLLITSPDRLSRALGALCSGRMLLVAAAVCCGAVLFIFGRYSAGVPADLLAQVESLQLEIQQQQGQVDRLRRDNRHSIDALAARLAELQAASTRVDALGERLAQMGQLTLEEFDFSEPAPVGGPADFEPLGSADEHELLFGIDSLSRKLRRQSSQLDALQFLMVNRQLESDLTPAGWPVRKGWVSSGFGERNDPFTGQRVQHRGLDFAGTRGTEVLSVASGVVVWSAGRAGYGNTVEIDHGNGYLTRYAHNEQLAVTPGEHVTAGQVIARMGSTGRASAPHVHFEVLKNGARIDPARFVGHLR